jgi:hypothetical protein
MIAERGVSASPENFPAQDVGAPGPGAPVALPTAPARSVRKAALGGAQVYGLMEVAMVFIQGLHMFAEVGIGTSIVQSERGDDPEFLDTAWTLQIVRVTTAGTRS